ncbi:RDD family protein [Streptococcus moroccensis]|uniref:RDD family membrane protein YckC n=1 Tax=Streptococcus moroccensis TaxID=1451356 RepID=A0ABT9YRV5_9STRE|nr:RDD family protein [Streptococcus moroccensis]MDQ0222728.1 putative RDD family membrane protein YckC [Streptococcus moroccensis]
MEQLPLKKWPKQVFGGFWIRLAAFLIDSLLVNAITKILLNLSVHHFIAPTDAREQWWYSLIKLIIVLAYFSGTMLYFKGQTVGKYLLNLKVVNFKTGQSDVQTLLIRELAGRTILHFLPIVAVTLIFTRHRQHLMDMLCDTVVINLNQVDYFKKAREAQLILPSDLAEPASVNTSLL